MPAKNFDLHGFVPDRSPVALLLIDVINDLEWPGGDLILPHALEMARAIAALKAKARQCEIPIVYANDNFGRWQSDFRGVVQHCLEDGVRGQAIVELLQPDEEDYFVLKPKHSGFFSSTLDTLLSYLQVKSLVLTGIAGNICVLFTANDAYMRDYNLFVPGDCTASNTVADNQYALEQMAVVLKADITPSTELNFEKIISTARRAPSGT